MIDKDWNDIVHNSSDADPLSALAFKVANDPFIGSLTFTRIYSGDMEAGTTIYSLVKEQNEHIGHMFQMH